MFASRCGDGRSTWDFQDGLLSGEECDDGGVQSGDGCSASCKVEPWWSCSPPSTFSRSVCHEWPNCSSGMMGEDCSLLCTAPVIHPVLFISNFLCFEDAEFPAGTSCPSAANASTIMRDSYRMSAISNSLINCPHSPS